MTAAGRNLDTVIIPKARRARDVWWVDVLLSQLEAKLNLGNKIRLEVLIEEVEGLANAEEIAVASPRLDALIFGVGDFSLSQGPGWTPTSCRWANIPAISGNTPATR